MSMKMKMAILQRLKSNWEGMLKLLYPTYGTTTHRHTHSDGTHDHHRPPPSQWRAEPQQPNYLREMVIPKQQAGGSNSNFEGTLKWWEQRSNPICNSYPPPPPNNHHSEEDDENSVAWRVYEIAEYLKVAIYDDYDSKIEEEHPVQFLHWLDELQGYAVEYKMEVAHELHSIDCLVPLLHHVLFYQHAGIRAKTAELITAMVHNNPSSQQLVMKLYGLDPLLSNFTQDLDATSRAKALGAISALIRNNKPGITAFQLADGPEKLSDYALSTTSADSVLQREALNLIQYLLHENSLDCDTITELELPRIMMHLAASSDDDAEVRVAALRGLLALVRYQDKKIRDKVGGNSGQLLVKNDDDDQLKQVLQQLIKRISAMAPEGLFAAREEMSLVDSLWNACSNEPSSLKRFEPFFDQNLDC